MELFPHLKKFMNWFSVLPIALLNYLDVYVLHEKKRKRLFMKSLWTFLCKINLVIEYSPKSIWPCPIDGIIKLRTVPYMGNSVVYNS